MVRIAAGEGSAEERAIEVAVGYLDAGALPCRRLEDTVIWDGPVFDCPDHTRRPWMHQVFVPIPGEGVSALLFVQARGDTFDEVAAEVGPVVASFIWR